MSFITEYRKGDHSYWNAVQTGATVYSVGAILTDDRPDEDADAAFKERQRKNDEIAAMAIDAAARRDWQQMEDVTSSAFFDRINPRYGSDPASLNGFTEEALRERMREKQSVGKELEERRIAGQGNNRTWVAGLVTKIDSNGEVIWENAYTTDLGERDTYFKQVVPCDNGDILVAGVFGRANGVCLYRIDSNGRTKWQKEFPIVFRGEENFKVTTTPTILKIGVETFFVLIAEEITADGKLVRVDNYLYKLDKEANLLVSTLIMGNEFNLFLDGADIFQNNIVLYGSSVEGSNFSSQKGLHLELTKDLKLIDAIDFLTDVPNAAVSYGFMNESALYLLRSGQTHYLLQLNSLDSDQEVKAFSFDNDATIAFFNQKNIYLQSSGELGNTISRLDAAYKPEWTIAIDKGNPHYRLMQQVSDRSILLADNFIGLTDSDANICISEKRETLQVYTKTVTLKFKEGLECLEQKPRIEDVKTSPKIIRSKSRPVCEFQEDEETCGSDEIICQLLKDLEHIYNDCSIVAPDKLGNLAFGEHSELPGIHCITDFLAVLLEYNDAFPYYNLLYRLANQIDKINYFLQNIDPASYQQCWEAIVFILGFLKSIGHCQCCSDALSTEGNTLLQSDYLYIQAAGSDGGDSTAGIHVRWALRDVLASHIPKGNYATTNANFNKQDDFVRIYRAIYDPVVVELNFESLSPKKIDHAAQTFYYTVGKRTFCVTFLDIANYQKSRAKIDPEKDAKGFIAEYGNQELKIEIKDDLFFGVSFNLDGDDNENMEVEIQRVEKNVANATQGTSFWKNGKLSDFREKTIYAENARSMIVATAAKKQAFRFEFYGDFIQKNIADGNWAYLRKHALTISSTKALQRFEPKEGCLDKWLRFNDGAYLNKQNYIDKWGGSKVVAPYEQINNTVKQYIALSDNKDNPAALEDVPMTSSGDPSLPAAPDQSNETMQVSNLMVLNIGSLDFHIARMLGLGLLDFVGETKEERYVYMASYETFIDLDNDENAESPKHTKHLYCSLPTSSNDQRLPIPVDLKELKPGIFYENTTQQTNARSLTDADGYSHDGESRFISLFVEEFSQASDNDNPPPKWTTDFDSSLTTFPVFAGLEYRKKEADKWSKPELSNDRDFFNIDDVVTDDSNRYLAQETIPILIPKDGKALFVHQERENGWHAYSTYGINWFSRATQSKVVKEILTKLPIVNTLMPPANVRATLIQPEGPLMFTTAEEQSILSTFVANTDNTLVRLTFSYNHCQELISRQKAINGIVIDGYREVPDEEELFAEEIEIFFRQEVPSSVSGQIKTVTDHPNDPSLAIIATDAYVLNSLGNNQSIHPNIPQIMAPCYIGGILKTDESFVVKEITKFDDNPEIVVYKKPLNDNTLTDAASNPPAFQSPVQGSMFFLVENMQTPDNWTRLDIPPIDNPVKTALTPIRIDNIDPVKNVHREEILIVQPDNTTELREQKFRGIYQPATIEKIKVSVPTGQSNQTVNTHVGGYKITFKDCKVNQHSQLAANPNDLKSNHLSVCFQGGVVRIHTLGKEKQAREDFDVVKAENIGSTTDNLVLYIADASFPDDSNGLATYKRKLMDDSEESVDDIWINYYPDYKVYLTQMPKNGLTKEKLIPKDASEVGHSVFGLRSHDFPNEVVVDGVVRDNDIDFYSRFSIPALMFARGFDEPKQPQKPLGGTYATRPDFYGKSTFTFSTEFDHKPYSVQFYRGSDIQILAALYSNKRSDPNVRSTLEKVQEEIFQNGKEDRFTERWQDFIDFQRTENTYKPFGDKDDKNKVSLPMPDNENFIKAINDFITERNNHYYPNYHIDLLTAPIFGLLQIIADDGAPNSSKLTILDFIKEVVYECFVPLTEIPVIYRYIKDGNYRPIAKKQKIRDRNGNLLSPTDADFDMAPMMKVLKTAPDKEQVGFTDFGLDGASNAKYFYAAREMNAQMQFGPFSPIMGPISLVNTAPPVAPAIVKIVPVLENRTLNIRPGIRFHINGYAPVVGVDKAYIYRTDTPANAMSIRTMTLVKEINLAASGVLANSVWEFEDDFADLGYVPFSDPFFYRLVVSRTIQYNDPNNDPVTEKAFSDATNVIIANIVENYSPESPKLEYYSAPLDTATGILASVTFSWKENTYKGNYHVYQLNAQGNWQIIAKLMADVSKLGLYQVKNPDSNGNWIGRGSITSFDGTVYLPLELTLLNTDKIATTGPDGATRYSHFKVMAENTAGMVSTEDNILSIYSPSGWKDFGGIGDMVISATFYIR